MTAPSGIGRTTGDRAAAGRVTRPGGSFAVARAARLRAAVSVVTDSPDLRRALERLETLLSSGRPLRTDVPRGFYLDILV